MAVWTHRATRQKLEAPANKNSGLNKAAHSTPSKPNHNFQRMVAIQLEKHLWRPFKGDGEAVQGSTITTLNKSDPIRKVLTHWVTMKVHYQFEQSILYLLLLDNLIQCRLNIIYKSSYSDLIWSNKLQSLTETHTKKRNESHKPFSYILRLDIAEQ